MWKLMLSAATIFLVSVVSMDTAQACLDCRSRPEHYYVYGYGITNPGYFSGVTIRIREPRVWYPYQHARRYGKPRQHLK